MDGGDRKGRETEDEGRGETSGIKKGGGGKGKGKEKRRGREQRGTEKVERRKIEIREDEGQ